jgi:hypothetical protein
MRCVVDRRRLSARLRVRAYILSRPRSLVPDVRCHQFKGIVTAGAGIFTLSAAVGQRAFLAECGDGEWRTINAIAERIRKGRDQEHQTPAEGSG